VIWCSRRRNRRSPRSFPATPVNRPRRFLAVTETIDAFVKDLADRLAADPPIALAQTKALLNEGPDRTLRDALANEARAGG
jgi:enoyl-CoA hydratase/carnithine racemase